MLITAEQISRLPTKAKTELLALLRERERRKHAYRYKTFYSTRYPWQKRFLSASANYRFSALIAANRVGKTDTATYADAIHALGEYPDDWEGYRFDFPPLIWCLGYSGEKCRDLLQAPIIGTKDANGIYSGGFIPPERILQVESMQGTTGALRSVYVRHASGGISKIQFWSYTQGQHALMGDSVDWFHIDEEPEDEEIYPQVLTRTATGDRGRGGRGILTFTPENGRTELVLSFLERPSKDQFCMNVGWDDAPHLTEETKQSLLAAFPPYQRDMRTKGIPMLGHGRIFDFDETTLKVNPFECPDHWWVINGCDFGWDHPQAHVQLWWDKDEDIFYVAHAWKKQNCKADEAWRAVKPWAKDVPVAWPHDGLQHEKGGGEELATQYRNEGFRMLADHATWPEGGNGVEVGIQQILELMLEGRFKIFNTCEELLEEIRLYHRDDHGKIVKLKDDLISAMRYAYMMRRFAKMRKAITKPTAAKIPKPIRPIRGKNGR